MNKTKIEWCDSTWNPLTGCLHDCEYCYARKIANRFQRKDYECANCNICSDCIGKEVGACPEGREYMQSNKLHELYTPVYSHYPKKRIEPYPYGFEPTMHYYRLDEPARRTKGQNIFVCSMADLFGEWVPQEWIREVWTACTKADWHNYLFLTKNPERYKEIYRSELDYRCYMWFGTTATDTRSFAFKGQNLFDSTGEIEERHAKRFISIEPLHEAINEKTLENVKYLDWVIIGAETGNSKGKVIPKKEWIDSIVKQCKAVDVPVFMKDSLIPVMGEENMLWEFPEELRR